MQKIPMPAVIGAVIVVVALAIFIIARGSNKPSGDSGDVKAITSEIIQNNPKNAPEVPDDQKPAAMAVMGGKASKKH